MRLELAGETVELLAERALWWPAGGDLMVADVHLGKGAAFRWLGQPVPSGTTAANLARLDALVRRLSPRRLIVLGDFVHARESLQPAVLGALDGWLTARPSLRVAVVTGNHDRHAGALPASLGIERIGDRLLSGPFELVHDLDDPALPAVPPDRIRVGGHVHPVCRLRAAGDALRLPCFVIGARRALLPAFGEFTGGHPVRPARGQVVYVVGAGHVWALPSPPGRGRAVQRA